MCTPHQQGIPENTIIHPSIITTNAHHFPPAVGDWTGKERCSELRECRRAPKGWVALSAAATLAHREHHGGFTDSLSQCFESFGTNFRNSILFSLERFNIIRTKASLSEQSYPTVCQYGTKVNLIMLAYKYRSINRDIFAVAVDTTKLLRKNYSHIQLHPA